MPLTSIHFLKNILGDICLHINYLFCSENKNEVNTLDLEKKISEMKLTIETLTKRNEEVEQQLTKVKDEQK